MLSIQNRRSVSGQMNTTEPTADSGYRQRNLFIQIILFPWTVLKWIWILRRRFFFSLKKMIFRIIPYLEKRRWHAKIIRRFLKYSFNLILSIILFFLAVDINFLWLFGSSPDIKKDKSPEMNVASELYTSDSVLIGKYFRENRIPVAYSEISKNIINALVATEDARFYEHSGVDIKATFSIFWYLVNGDNRGGSTITQQLAKNLFKTRKTSIGLLGHVPFLRTVVSKTKEWMTAIRLEQNYSKEDILTMYLNAVDFGSNTYGIKVACKTYFNKLPSEVSVQEAATLIGMLKAPTYYSPILHPDRCRTRRNTVLMQMKQNSYISESQYDSLSRMPVVLDYEVEDPEETELGSYIRTAVASDLKAWCKETGYDIYTSGLKIYTSIDSKLQKYAEESVNEQMRTLQSRFDAHWGSKNPWIDAHDNEIKNFIEDQLHESALYKNLLKKYRNNEDSVTAVLNRPHKMNLFSWKKKSVDTVMSSLDSMKYMKRFLNAGFVVMDPFTGKLLSWVGGISYKFFKYDHVNQSKRQPGSTFKPFVYCAAIDNGWAPCDKIVDQQVVVKYKENGEEKTWNPHNFDWKYTGQPMSLRHAMAKSCNSVTVQLEEKIGYQTVADYAEKLGISSELKPVPSIGLGSSDVTLLEMVAAYSVFINKGIYSKPMLVVKITDRNGKVIKEFKPVQKRVLSEETAWLMTYMLKGGIEEPEGSATPLFIYSDIFGDNDIGGKTGTSSNYSDGWFMGVTKNIVAGSWVGGEDRCIHFRKQEKMHGCYTALPIFGIFMTKVYDDKTTGIEKGKFPEPTVKITKDYYCPTPWEKDDSTATDESDGAGNSTDVKKE